MSEPKGSCWCEIHQCFHDMTEVEAERDGTIAMQDSIRAEHKAEVERLRAENTQLHATIHELCPGNPMWPGDPSTCGQSGDCPCNVRDDAQRQLAKTIAALEEIANYRYRCEDKHCEASEVADQTLKEIR